MINEEAHAICKQRGHHPGGIGQTFWSQCRRCGVWLKEVHTTQEREDDPPEDEQNRLLEPLHLKKESRKFREALSRREKQMVNGVVRGLSNKVIGLELHLAEETVKEYLKHIFRKTGATNRTELAVMSIK